VVKKATILIYQKCCIHCSTRSCSWQLFNR